MSETLAGRKRSAPDDDDAGGGRAATSAAAGLPSPSNAPRPDEEAGTKASGTASKTNELVGPLLIGEASDLTPEACEQFYNLFGFISGGFWRKDLPGFLKRLRKDLEAYPIFARLYSDHNRSLLDALFESVDQSQNGFFEMHRLRADEDFQAAMNSLVDANPSALLWKRRRHLKHMSKFYPNFLPWLAEKFPWILDLSSEPLRGVQDRPPHLTLFDTTFDQIESAFSPEERRQKDGRIMQVYLNYPQGLAQKDSDGFLPLHCAVGAFRDGFEIIKWLAEQYPVGLPSQNIHGHTPLHVAVQKCTDFKIIQWLGNRYPDAIHIVSCDDKSPLDLSLEQLANVCIRPNDSKPNSFFEPSSQVSGFLLKMGPSKIPLQSFALNRVWGFCHKHPVQDFALKLLRVLIGESGGTVDEELTKHPFPKAIVPLIAKEFQIISERDRIRKAHIMVGKYAEKESSSQKSEPSPTEGDQALISPSQQLFVAYRDWMNGRLAQKVSETPRILALRNSIKAIQEDFTSKGIGSVSGDTHEADENFLVDDDDDDDSHWDSEDEEDASIHL